MSENKKAAMDMVEYADILAETTLEEMKPEEAVKMVRDFCQTIIDWQPSVALYRDDPVMLGIHCLTVAELFKLAFVEAYGHTSDRLDAINSIKKAFDQS